MKFYICGAGGHAKVVLSTALALGLSVDGFLDDIPQEQGLQIFGVEVVGTIDANKGPARGILAIGDNKKRQALAKKLQDWEWVTIVHPRAYVHSTVSLGSGTVVFAGAIIQPDARIGSHTIINTGATVDHDCLVGDFVHLAPGSHLAGSVTVEEGAFIGAGAVVLPGVKIGAWAVVGAGAVVIENLPPYVTAVGVPAKSVQRRT